MLSMTAQSLTHLLNVGATTTAKSRRQHVRKLPEGAHVVKLLFCAFFLLQGSKDCPQALVTGVPTWPILKTLTRFLTPC
jgi:hypothetical protein